MRYFMNNDEKLGYVIVILRKERKLTQEKISEKAGIDYKYFGRIEHGKSSVTFSKLVKISQALEVSLIDLMTLFEKHSEY